MRSQVSLVVLSSLAGCAAASGAVELTLDNFESTISGKNAFVKFLAPWCGHCKSMAPAWNELADDYAGSSSVLIGDADCTADGKELCQKFDVSGYPTIKYFKDGAVWEGEDYQGGRDAKSLKEFTEENLEIKCDVNNPEECSDKEKGYIEKMKGKSPEDRKKQLDRLETMKDGKMKPELKQWLVQRLRILKGLEAGAGGDEL